uniref:LAGLIDADG homing endonuclease n=1 Tax=Romanomermis culicivorax TaxID=13658 RepID=A0A915KC09_ROMCU
MINATVFFTTERNGTQSTQRYRTKGEFSFRSIRFEVTVVHSPQNYSYPFRSKGNFQAERFKLLAIRSVSSKKMSTVSVAECNITFTEFTLPNSMRMGLAALATHNTHKHRMAQHLLSLKSGNDWILRLDKADLAKSKLLLRLAIQKE